MICHKCIHKEVCKFTVASMYECEHFKELIMWFDKETCDEMDFCGTPCEFMGNIIDRLNADNKKLKKSNRNWRRKCQRLRNNGEEK